MAQVVNKAGFESFMKKKRSKPRIVVYEPQRANERILAQQGLFTVCTSLNISHEAAIEKQGNSQIKEGLAKAPKKIIIKKGQKREILSHLHEMNINARTIYPGIDGLGKSIRESMRLGLGPTQVSTNLRWEEGKLVATPKPIVPPRFLR
jgi:hypothetical protein